MLAAMRPLIRTSCAPSVASTLGLAFTATTAGSGAL
jgi:hypothetical protein